MGTLRNAQTVYIDDKPTSAVTGHTVNGVLLGEPLELDGDPATYEYDDAAFPNGTVELVDGVAVVTPDLMDVI